MKPDLTDITLVVDCSGSMQQIREDAEGGINAFIAQQAKEPGDALLTLVQFNTNYEFLHTGLPISRVPKYRLFPQGRTALLDAVGKAIHDTGTRLAKMAEKDRPGLVVFVVMTDGLENSSCESSKDDIKKMIEHQQEEYNWHFTFLGANQDAFAEAGGMGIHAAGVANFSVDKVGAACMATGAKLGRMRGQSLVGDTVCNKFTEQERKDMA